MNLVIDIGNSFIKAGIFEGKELLHAYYHLKKEDLIKIAQESTFQFVLVSSVKEDSSEIVSFFNACESCLQLSSETDIPLNNHYKTPKTLGMDRICGAVGSALVFPSTNRLVIDAGTCIT